MDLLADDVKQAIQDASNIDLSGYATKEEMNGKVAQGDYDTKIAELENLIQMNSEDIETLQTNVSNANINLINTVNDITNNL